MSAYLNNQRFDFGGFTKSSQRVMHLIQKTVFNGYSRQFGRDKNGQIEHNQNIFVWKSDTSFQRVRAVLVSLGKDKFVWSVAFSSTKKQNHETTEFLSSDTLSYYDELKECLEIIKRRIKEND